MSRELRLLIMKCQKYNLDLGMAFEVKNHA